MIPRVLLPHSYVLATVFLAFCLATCTLGETPRVPLFFFDRLTFVICLQLRVHNVL